MEFKNRVQMMIFFALLILGFIIAVAVPHIGFIFAILLWIYAFCGLKVIYQYEKGVLFTLGRFVGVLDAGLVWIAPIFQSIKKIDLRIQTVDLPKQEVITKDNVPIKVNGTVFFKVQYPEKAVLNVKDYRYATSMYSQTVLRDIIGGKELDEVLQKRDEIAEEIRKIVDEITDAWGIVVTGVRLQDIELPDEMKRAIAKQAEAERERRSVIIKSEGEVKAAENLAKAGKIIAKIPQALQLRMLQTLQDVAVEKNSTIVFPIPIELLESFKKEKKE